MAVNRRSLYDYGEAEERQFDLVDAIEKGGSMLSGLERMKAYGDKKYEDKGGFFGAYKKPASDLWGNFSSEEKLPDYATLSGKGGALEAIKGMKEGSDERKALQGRVNKAFEGAPKGDWAKVTSNWSEANPVTEAVEGKGLLGKLGGMKIDYLKGGEAKTLDIGGRIQKLAGKAGGVIDKLPVDKIKQLMGPAGMVAGVVGGLKEINDKAKVLEGESKDLGTANVALGQQMKTGTTDMHKAVAAAKNRVIEGGSQLNEQYGARATKILSSADMIKGKQGFENNDMNTTNTDLRSLASAQVNEKNILNKQAKYQIDQGIDQWSGASSGILQEMQKNAKLRGEIDDQREQLTGVANIGMTIAGGLV